MRRGFALFAFGLGFFACAKRIDTTGHPGLHAGQRLELRLPLFPTGETFDLLQDRGNVVLLDVWATWCEPCRNELAIFQALSRKYGQQCFRVYALNVDEDTRQIEPFLRQNGIDLPVLIDAHAAFSESTLRIRRLPTNALVDREGVVQRVYEGLIDDPSGFYSKEIEMMLSQFPSSRPSPIGRGEVVPSPIACRELGGSS